MFRFQSKVYSNQKERERREEHMPRDARQRNVMLMRRETHWKRKVYVPSWWLRVVVSHRSVCSRFCCCSSLPSSFSLLGASVVLALTSLSSASSSKCIFAFNCAAKLRLISRRSKSIEKQFVIDKFSYKFVFVEMIWISLRLPISSPFDWAKTTDISWRTAAAAHRPARAPRPARQRRRRVFFSFVFSMDRDSFLYHHLLVRPLRRQPPPPRWENIFFSNRRSIASWD